MLQRVDNQVQSINFVQRGRQCDAVQQYGLIKNCRDFLISRVSTGVADTEPNPDNLVRSGSVTVLLKGRIRFVKTGSIIHVSLPDNIYKNERKKWCLWQNVISTMAR